MKINKIIISSNDSPEYIEFLPLISKAWKKFLGDSVELIMGYITRNPETKWSRMKDYATIVPFWDDRVPSGNLAKISRLLLASKYDNEYCLLSDIDMLPLQSEYYSKNSDLLINDNILFYTSDAYNQDNRFPICYILAKGSTYKQIINPQNLPGNSVIENWMVNQLDHKDNICKTPFSDESLLRYLLYKWNKPDRIQKLQRGWGLNSTTTGCNIRIANKRIDRASWFIDTPKLYEGYYIDAHLLRPLNSYQLNIQPLINYIGQ